MVNRLDINRFLSDSDRRLLTNLLLQLLVEYRFLLVFHQWLKSGYLNSSEQPVTMQHLFDYLNLDLELPKPILAEPESESAASDYDEFATAASQEVESSQASRVVAQPVALKSEFSVYNIYIYRRAMPLAKINQIIMEVIGDSHDGERRQLVETYHQHLMMTVCRPKQLYDVFAPPKSLDSVWDAKNYSITKFYQCLYLTSSKSAFQLYYTVEYIDGFEFYTAHIFVLRHRPMLQHIGIQLAVSQLLNNKCSGQSNKLSLTLFNQIQADYLNTDYEYFWAPAWPVMSHILIKYQGFASLEFGPELFNPRRRTPRVKTAAELYYNEYQSQDDDDDDQPPGHRLVQWIKYQTSQGSIQIDMKKYYQLAGQDSWTNGVVVSNFNDPQLDQLISYRNPPEYQPNQSVVQILQDVIKLNATDTYDKYRVTYFKKLIHRI